MEDKEMREHGDDYGRYMRDDERYDYGARMRDGRGRYMEGNYGRTIEPRMRDRLDRITDGAEDYSYGKDRYRHGGDSKERMQDGLEKMMYAICTFVEYVMDVAETPEEKEIIRKHIQKIANL